MKTLLLTFAFVLGLTLHAGAATNTVTFNLADFTTGVITNRQVKIEPRSTPRAGPGDSILSRDSLFRFSDTNGTFIVTNIQYGTYLCTLMGPYAKSQFRIYVPDTNDTMLASNLLLSDSDTGIDTEDGLSIDLE